MNIEYKLSKSKMGIRTLDTEQIKLSKRKAQAVFDVNLENRDYTITWFKDKDLDNVEIIFHDKDNIFGWIERLTKVQFDNCLKLV